MKKVSIILLLCLSFGIQAQAPKKSDWEKDGLAGPVKRIELWRIEYQLENGRTVENKRVLLRATSYNSEGGKDEQVDFDPFGKRQQKIVYTYDSLGRFTGYDEYYRDADNPRKHIYFLNSDGNPTEYNVYDADGSPAGKFFYKYDAAGNKTEEIFQSWNGSRIGRVVSTYDEKGNQLTQTSYGQDNAISWNTVLSYDREGRRLGWIQYQKGTLRYKIFSKYDEKGRIVEQETFEFNAPSNMITSHAPVPGKVLYAYDDEKRTREVATYSADGQLSSSILYTYDEKGNQIADASSKPDGSSDDKVIQFSTGRLSGRPIIRFDYDEHGNWLRKSYLIQPADSDKPKAYSGEYRVITYF